MTSFYQQQKKSTLSLESLILGSNNRNKVPISVQMYPSVIISFTLNPEMICFGFLLLKMGHVNTTNKKR